MTRTRHVAFVSLLPIAALSIVAVWIMAGCSAAPSQEQATAPAQTPAAASADTPAPVAPTPTKGETPDRSTTGIAGAWEGEIALPASALKIVVAFEDQGGRLGGDIDIPAQLAADIPLHDIRWEAPALHFEMLSGAQVAVFDGELQADGSIAGTFTQSGYTGGFTLKPQAPAAVETVSYRQEELTFENGDVTLAGTLALPAGDGPFPAVLLLSGSGQQNRDEEIEVVPGYRPFRVLADTLTQQGIAVLRYDDRGVGKSGGDATQATTVDFAADAEAAFDALRAHPAIDSAQVGLLGHSEGGIIAAMLAARNPNVAFVIGMAPPAVPGDDFLVKQIERLAAASGASEADVALAGEQERKLLDMAIAQDWPGLADYLKQIMLEQLQALPAEQQAALGDPEALAAERIPPQVEAMKGPWFQNFITYDPGEDWARVKAPVLALFGGLDVQVDADQNMSALEAALATAKNSDVTVKVFPEANHLFLQAKTGGVEEYASLPTDFVPGFLDTISEWLLAHVETAR